MSSSDHMAAGAASGALIGMFVVLILMAVGVIEARFLEWFVVAIIGSLVAGGIVGVMVEIFNERGR